jgi:hypothetical protein
MSAMTNRILQFSGTLLILGLSPWGLGAGPATTPAQRDNSVQTFDGSPPPMPVRSSHIRYELEPATERFFVHVPSNYNGREDFGLIVFVPAENAFAALPRGWDEVLADRKLLFVAPQKAGDDQPVDRRYGLAVLAEGEMLVHYRVDPARVFAAGFSGGARIANHLGFYQSDVFHGTIQNCGADFYRHVPQTHPLAPDTPPGDYGLFSASPLEVDNARQNVRFALITGSRDFRHGNILDVYEGGYADEGFAVKLFDVPDMPHTYCDAETLAGAIAFVDRSPAAASPPIPSVRFPTSRPSEAALTSRPASAPLNESDKRSAQELVMARNYLANNRPDLARSRLQRIVQTYPGTPAGRAAEALLQQLDGR